MSHFTVFQEPCERNTLLILPSVNDILSNHVVCLLRKINTIKEIFQKYGMNLIITMNYRTPPRFYLFETMLLQQNTITK